jgi:hypothetical protein
MTKELSVTYHAPKGDSKVVEMLGFTFYDGKQETVTVEDRAAAQLQANRHFECSEAKDHTSDPSHAKEKETHKGR